MRTRGLVGPTELQEAEIANRIAAQIWPSNHGVGISALPGGAEKSEERNDRNVNCVENFECTNRVNDTFERYLKAD